MSADSTRRALVTGGNRGLGLETCRQLGQRGLHVVLTARDAEKARAAAAELCASGLVVRPHRLDVTDDAQVAETAAFVRDELGGLDVLVNNAGIALDGFDAGVARRTVETNTLAVMRLTDALLPHVGEHGRLVMVSSGVGELSKVSAERRARFTDEALTRDELRGLLEQFVADVTEGRHRAAGWPTSAYAVSKIGLNAFTRLLARELTGSTIKVNAVCPGWVRTAMGGRSAPRSVEEGADTIVWAASLPPEGPSGGFFRDRQPARW